jgi:aminoglycoside 6'-N-acetyltransferase I
MQIVDLPPDDQQVLEQVAQMLYDGFKEHAPNAWPDLKAAAAQVRSSLDPGRINRIAVHDNGMVLGWIGAIPDYSGRAWELHPLVVRPEFQESGIGRALVTDLERLIRLPEGITLYLGTDDEDNRTSLAGTELYTNIMEHIANIKNLDRHPFEFYQKLGFVIVGVIPDANGPGKPDIIMAKRVVG